MKSHKDLIVWQKSMELVEEVYSICRQLPKSERFVLIPQLQRAVISIPSNIAEGYRRNHRREYVQSLSVSNGSAGELETQLLLGKTLYCDQISFEKGLDLVDEVLKMLFSLIKSLK